MPLMVSASSDKDFIRAPVGVHQAVCVDVVDLGVEENKMYNKVQHKIRIRWQIAELMDSGDNAGERFSISKKYTASLSEKAHLRADLVAWRGRPFTDAELQAFDLENVIGANAMLNVINEIGKTNGKTYTVVASLSPLYKGLPKMTPDRYVREKDRPGYKPPTGLVASAYARNPGEDELPAGYGEGEAEPESDTGF